MNDDILDDTVNKMISELIQATIDRKNKVFDKFQRQMVKIQKEHDRQMKSLEKIMGNHDHDTKDIM